MNTVSPQSYPHELNGSNTNHAYVDNSVDFLCARVIQAGIFILAQTFILGKTVILAQAKLGVRNHLANIILNGWVLTDASHHQDDEGGAHHHD